MLTCWQDQLSVIAFFVTPLPPCLCSVQDMDMSEKIVCMCVVALQVPEAQLGVYGTEQLSLNFYLKSFKRNRIYIIK